MTIFFTWTFILPDKWSHAENNYSHRLRQIDSLCSSQHEDQEAETSQENHKFLQIQLQLKGTLSDSDRRHVLSGSFKKQDSDQRTAAQIPDGGGSVVHHEVSTCDFQPNFNDQLESSGLLLFSSCALKELESLGKELYGAKIILQKYQVRKCPHMKNPIPASECLLSMLEETNPHHYFVATQVYTNIQQYTQNSTFSFLIMHWSICFGSRSSWAFIRLTSSLKVKSVNTYCKNLVQKIFLSKYSHKIRYFFLKECCQTWWN